MGAYSKDYLNDVVENQGKLFDFVAQEFPNTDTEDFIRTYMKSKTRKNIDESKAYVNTMNAKELWTYFTETENYSLKEGVSIDGFMPDWIGQFYAYYQWYYDIPSSEVLNSVPLHFLKQAYHGLHDLELDLAVKKVGNAAMNIVCFHNPDEDNGYLSNWYLSTFIVDGVTFSSMEQFMMYRKAIQFGDEKVADEILSMDDVAEIKSLGRQVSNYDESVWNGIRQIIVYEGLVEKFAQNEDLKAKLKSTGKAVLAECAVKDRIWGIGLSMRDADRFDKSKWNGQNLLGYTLMMVREGL